MRVSADVHSSGIGAPVAVGTVIENGGTQVVGNLGYTIDTTISSGGLQEFYGDFEEPFYDARGGSGTKILAGGKQIVDGGVVVDTTVLGTQIVGQDGEISGTVVSSGGFVTVSAYGYASNVTVLSGGHLTFAGGTLSGLKVAKGATVTVARYGSYTASAGSTLSGIHVQSGGEVVFDGGKMPGLAVASGGSEGVASGQTVSSVINGAGVKILVSSGGTLVVASGTTDSNVNVLSGGEAVLAGGKITGLTISSGGSEGLASGATASGLTVSSGTTLIVSSGAAASNTDLKGGTEVVLAGGTFAGTLTFGTNAKLTAPAGSAGLSFTASGFKTTDVLNFTDMTAQYSKLNFTENAGKTAGTLTVTDSKNGETATVALLGQYTAGDFHLRSDTASGLDIYYGTAPSLIVSSGDVFVASKGTSYTNVQVLSGGEIVYDGGAFPDVDASSGGREVIASGVTVKGLTLPYFGALIVSSGGTASDVQVLDQSSIVYAGGNVDGITFVSDDAYLSLNIAAGVTVSGLTITLEENLVVSSGGTAKNITLNGGLEIVAAGGKVAGTVTFVQSSELAIHTAASGTLSFVAAQFGSSDVIDLANFAFKPAETLSFVENGAKTSGVLTVTDGTLHASITLLGQYTAAGFTHVSDGYMGGTYITYSATTAAGAHADLAVHRR